MEEMEMAARQGKNAKVPGYHVISHDLLKHKWKTIRHDLLQILNEMYVGEAIMDSQKHGIIVCVPKTKQPVRPEDYRALTPLNADFKLLSRILANRLNKWNKDLLHSSEHFGIADKNTFGTLASIRETIDHVETTNLPTSLLTLYLAEAFDNIAHA